MEEGNKHILTALLLGLRDEIYRRFEEMSSKWAHMMNFDNECQVRAAIQQLTGDLQRFESTDMKQIEAIEKALVRVSSDRYGICEKCGDFISEQRLLVVPWTSECGHCSTAEPMRPAAPPAIVRHA